MKLTLFAIIGICFLLCSCSLFKEPEFERLNDVELKELNPDYADMELSIVISNKNWYGITVKSLNLAISDTNNVKLGDIVMTQPLKIKKHAADTVYFEILMETRKVTRLVSHNAQKVEFVVRADAVAKVFGISKRVRIKQKQEINFTKILEQILPSIPSDITVPTIKTGSRKKVLISNTPKPSSPIKADIFKVMKTSITDVGLKETELTVKFLILNPYGLSFNIRDFPSDIWVNDKYAGKGKLAKLINFNENIFSAEGELVFNLNNFNSILLASNALLKRDMNYQVNGTLLAEGFGAKISKPFKFKGTVEIGKKDK